MTRSNHAYQGKAAAQAEAEARARLTASAQAEAELRARLRAEAEQVKAIAEEAGMPIADAIDAWAAGASVDDVRGIIQERQAEAHAAIMSKWNGKADVH